MSKSIDLKQVNHDKAVKAAPTLAKIITDASSLTHVVVNHGAPANDYKGGKSDYRPLPSKVYGPACQNSEVTKTQFTVEIAGNTQLSHLFDVIANAICIMTDGTERPNGTYAGSKKGDYKTALEATKNDLEPYRARIEDCGLNVLKLKDSASKSKSEFMNTIAYSNGDDTQRINVGFVTMLCRDSNGKVAYHKDGSIKYEIAPSITLGDKVFSVNLEEATRAAQEVIIKNAIQEIKTEARSAVAGVKEVAKQKAAEIKQAAQGEVEALLAVAV